MYISGNYIKEAFMKHRYPSLLIFDLILFTILLLMPSLSGFPAALRSVLLILSGLVAVWLLILISRCKETVSGVALIKLEPADHFNPSQYLSRGGSPCAGSDGRYEATFRFPDQTEQTFSLSAHQAQKLSPGMRGQLCYRDHVYLSFSAQNK